ncbi:MAG: 3-isopropylmalate dehydratase small subunit [Pseudomonadota bacterium]
MEPFKTLTVVAAPLDMANVNTDQIIPARFLRKPRSAGYGNFLFNDIRQRADGTANPDFVLNQPAYRPARILVAGPNFGCGSSREGAVYALHDSGFRAVIAPSFGDIFFNNCAKNGVVAAKLPEAAVADLIRQLVAAPGATMTVDLAQDSVIAPDGTRHGFALEPSRKHCLIEGLDDIQLTLQHDAAIAALEQQRYARLPWLS